MAAHKGECLSDATVLDFVQGTLAATSATAAQEHLTGCADCRAVVAEAARMLVSEDSASEQLTKVDTASQAPRPLEPGTLVSRYRIEATLGAGAGGVVYAAFDQQLKRRVALKILRASGIRTAPGPEARERLLREAEAMAQLSHPNVVNVHDAGIFGDDVFIVMELVEGQTLARWLRGQQRPWREVVTVFTDAARGLAAAHGAGLVHRDFKPENVLIGSAGRARVADFGLARQMGAVGPVPPVEPSPAGQAFTAIAGTPAYMAPEQFLGAVADDKSDQFSFCVALFLALYRQHPFGDWTGGGSTLPPTPASPPEGSPVPARLHEILARGLRAERERRYPSLTGLIQELEAVLAGTAPRSRVRLMILGAAGLGLVTAYALSRARSSVCGNGVAELGEQCDDGNRSDGDRCLATCRLATCGDGHLRAGVEECDSGGDCSAECLRCREGVQAFVWPQTGSCYSRHEQPRSWWDAQTACEDLGGALVTYGSPPEARSAWEALLRGRAGASWIGYYPAENEAGFAWITGEGAAAAVPWAPDEPKGGCVFESSVEGGSVWGTAPCKETLPFVCERAPWSRHPRTAQAYRLFLRPLTRTDAAAACAATDGHLVTIGDTDEQAFVAAQTNLLFWTGQTATDAGGDCLAIGVDDQQHQRPCRERNPYMCEID